MSKLNSQQEQITKVTWAGLWINLILAALKIWAGHFGNSRAVLADGVHSLSDMATDFAVIVGARYWSAPPDSDHPYGHRRLESMIAVGIGFALAAVGVGLAWKAFNSIRAEAVVVDGYLPLIAALLSIVIKESLYRWTMAVGKRIHSPALKANAWHHRSDALSSIPAALAVLLSHLHPSLAICDPIGAILVSIFIVYSSWKICRPSLGVLLDEGVEEEALKKITETAREVPGVENVHDLRTRYLGGAAAIDLHIEVSPELTVREGHNIADAVENALKSLSHSEIQTEVVEVLVHVDPVGEELKTS